MKITPDQAHELAKLHGALGGRSMVFHCSDIAALLNAHAAKVLEEAAKACAPDESGPWQVIEHSAYMTAHQCADKLRRMAEEVKC